jgi:hypothetical protein
MITFVCAYPHLQTVDSMRGEVLGPLVPRTRAISYDSLFASDALRPSTYVFTDQERLHPAELRLSAHYYRRMAQIPGFRVLNDPARVRTRYSLLRALAEAGLNDFDAYPADGFPRPRRFPVFVRTASEHAGPIGDLIHDQAELDARLEELEAGGIPLVGLLVIEFCAERNAKGHYEKMSFFKVGDRISLAAMLVNEHWNVKDADESQRLTTPEMDRDLADAVAENRFAESLRAAFDVARIDYGRADVGFSGGRIQVYEINTNPNVRAHPDYRSEDYARSRQTFQARVGEMLHDIDLPMKVDPVPLNLGRLDRPARVRRQIARMLRDGRHQALEAARRGALVPASAE